MDIEPSVKLSHIQGPGLEQGVLGATAGEKRHRHEDPWLGAMVGECVGQAGDVVDADRQGWGQGS